LTTALPPPPLRFWILSALGATAALGVLGSLLPVVSGRTAPPEARRAAAVAADEAAHRGPAPRFAPEELAGADHALSAALAAWSRQQSRFVLRRDFRPVADALWLAERAARGAARLAAERLQEAHLGAEEAIAEARALHAHASTLTEATALPPGPRAHLLRARLLLSEAESLLGEGEPEEAAACAEHSQTELRRALGPALEAAMRYTSAEQVRTWERWVEETRAWSRTTGRPAIVVFKEKNLLTVLRGGAPVRSYPADVGRNGLALKVHVGDLATPEGRYRVVSRKDRGQSRYYRALLLDYPNEEDRRRLAAAIRDGGVPPGTTLGGSIEIHGEGGRGRNWTDGCVAVSNADMDDLFPRIPVGTRVTIVGGDGKSGTFSDLLARVGGHAEVGN
jgi:lipoprotein-anchoring transpeptidase ErfK/SrfK